MRQSNKASFNKLSLIVSLKFVGCIQCCNQCCSGCKWRYDSDYTSCGTADSVGLSLFVSSHHELQRE